MRHRRNKHGFCGFELFGIERGCGVISDRRIPFGGRRKERHFALKLPRREGSKLRIEGRPPFETARHFHKPVQRFVHGRGTAHLATRFSERKRGGGHFLPQGFSTKTLQRALIIGRRRTVLRCRQPQRYRGEHRKNEKHKERGGTAADKPCEQRSDEQ